jgi:hypothetical protein
MAGMNKGMRAQWIAFALAVPISLYVTFSVRSRWDFALEFNVGHTPSHGRF